MSWKQPVHEENPFVDGKLNENTYIPPSDPNIGTPSWLQDSGNTTSESSSNTPAKQVHPDVPKMITYTRVANVLLSILMILVSLLSLLTTNTATTGVLACYVVVFSCLLCCFETHLKQVSKFIALNFGFMYSAKSRTLFMIFIGTILFSFSLFGKLIGCFMIANACFNIFIIVKYPEFDEIQRTDAQQDIKDYLVANPAFSQQFISLGVQQTASIASSNPDIARQVVGSYFGLNSNTGNANQPKNSQGQPGNDDLPQFTNV